MVPLCEDVQTCLQQHFTSESAALPLSNHDTMISMSGGLLQASNVNRKKRKQRRKKKGAAATLSEDAAARLGEGSSQTPPAQAASAPPMPRPQDLPSGSLATTSPGSQQGGSFSRLDKSPQTTPGSCHSASTTKATEPRQQQELQAPNNGGPTTKTQNQKLPTIGGKANTAGSNARAQQPDAPQYTRTARTKQDASQATRLLASEAVSRAKTAQKPQPATTTCPFGADIVTPLVGNKVGLSMLMERFSPDHSRLTELQKLDSGGNGNYLYRSIRGESDTALCASHHRKF